MGHKKWLRSVVMTVIGNVICRVLFAVASVLVVAIKIGWRTPMAHAWNWLVLNWPWFLLILSLLLLVGFPIGKATYEEIREWKLERKRSAERFAAFEQQVTENFGAVVVWVNLLQENSKTGFPKRELPCPKVSKE